MDESSVPGVPAGLMRRLAAMVYDALLIIALWFVATFAMLPLTGGEAILASSQGLVAHLYHALLLALTAAYFGLCWMRSGQTLGMKAWRIRLLTDRGQAPGLAGVMLRFATGLVLLFAAALGIWTLRSPATTPLAPLLLLPALVNLGWIPFNRDRRSLQDRVGRLRVVRDR